MKMLDRIIPFTCLKARGGFEILGGGGGVMSHKTEQPISIAKEVK